MPQTVDNAVPSERFDGEWSFSSFLLAQKPIGFIPMTESTLSLTSYFLHLRI